MKLLVSDYDCTLFRNCIQIRANIEAIKKFRSGGNKFVIATGRSFMHIKSTIYSYKIPYDYLICNDGSTVFDKNDNLLSVEYLENYEIKDIEYYLQILKNSGFIDKITYYNEYTNVFPTYSSIIEIAANFKKNKSCTFYVKEIEDLFHSIGVYYFGNELYIKKPKNKSMAIKEIERIENVEPKNIFTVGDDFNDFEMIRDYNGYNMPFSHPSLRKVSNGTVTSVKQLIKKINK